MKYVLITCVAFVFLANTFSVQAQTGKKPLVYVSVEQPPVYPGGQDSLISFINRNIRYPETAITNGEQGTVFISFVVDSVGQVKEPQILKSASASLDAEAIRLVNQMPRWLPGKQNGRAVAVKINLPVKFQLANPALPQIETYPQFPGGETALAAFISKELDYPKEALEKNIEGTVKLSFTVLETGKFADVKVEQSPALPLSAAAVNVLFEMPAWQPAKTKTQAVAARQTISIPFSISKYREELATKPAPVTPVKSKLKQPKFPGGQAAMMQYLRTNIRYPESVRQAGQEGLVVLSFVVDENGQTKNIAILQSVHPDLDAEAKRVVSAMPKWKPGLKDNKPVNVRFTLPVRFSVNAG